MGIRQTRFQHSLIQHTLVAFMRLGAVFFVVNPLSVYAQEQGAAIEQADVDADVDSGAYLAARYAMLQNDYGQGSKWFDKALERDPGNPVLVEGGIVSHIGQGDFESAIEIATNAQNLTENIGSFGHLALLLRDVRAGDYSAILKNAPQRQINPLIDELLLAWASVGEGRMSEALSKWDKMAADANVRLFALYHKALALALAGDMASAEMIFASDLDTGKALGRRGIMAYVLILIQLDQIDKARGLLTQIAGNQDVATGGYSQLWAQLTNPKEKFNLIASPQEGIAEAIFNIAQVLSEERADTLTLIYASSAAYLDPSNTDANLLIGDILLVEGQSESAFEAYDRVPADDALWVRAEIGKSNVMLSQNNAKAAKDILQKLFDTYTESRLVATSYAEALRQNDDYLGAAQAYSRAIENAEKNEQGPDWFLYFLRGTMFYQAGEWPKSESDLRQALSLSPDQPIVLNYLGYSLLEENKDALEALNLIEKAVKLAPDEGAIIDSLGWAYFKLGRYEDALTQIERANLLVPDDPTVIEHLADIYWTVGRKNEARFQWRRALVFSPPPADVERIQNKLENGLPPPPKSAAAVIEKTDVN